MKIFSVRIFSDRKKEVFVIMSITHSVSSAGEARVFVVAVATDAVASEKNKFHLRIRMMGREVY